MSNRMVSDAQPSNYSAARIATLQAQDDDSVNPLCRTQLLAHGLKVERAIVFLHGFTNCPRQWVPLGQVFFDAGYNVFIPRMPHHGLRDRLTTALTHITAEEIIRWTDEMLDLARGLGERVVVAGLSLGGALALWAAQTRADVALAVAIAPMIAPRGVTRALLPVFLTASRFLPNFFVWWDRAAKENLPGPRHAYPRFPSRGMAAAFRAARRVTSAAFKPGATPAAQRVLLVTNANDPAVDNEAAKAIVARWRYNGATNVATYEFDASLGLIHDIIDPEQAQQRTDIVYPALTALIEEQSRQQR